MSSPRQDPADGTARDGAQDTAHDTTNEKAARR
jgi:hypothetical protein